jgi:hypothetical protein
LADATTLAGSALSAHSAYSAGLAVAAGRRPVGPMHARLSSGTGFSHVSINTRLAGDPLGAGERLAYFYNVGQSQGCGRKGSRNEKIGEQTEGSLVHVEGGTPLSEVRRALSKPI